MPNRTLCDRSTNTSSSSSYHAPSFTILVRVFATCAIRPASAYRSLPWRFWYVVTNLPPQTDAKKPQALFEVISRELRILIMTIDNTFREPSSFVSFSQRYFRVVLNGPFHMTILSTRFSFSCFNVYRS